MMIMILNIEEDDDWQGGPQLRGMKLRSDNIMILKNFYDDSGALYYYCIEWSAANQTIQAIMQYPW